MATLPASLLSAKEFDHSPVLLAVFTFGDGSALRLSTRNFSTGEGGNSFGANAYLARIDSYDISATQSRSQQGIDRISDVTVKLHNSDQTIFTQYEKPAGKGFKGALLACSLILADIDPATGLYVFSNDATPPVKFFGVCDAPSMENGGQMLVVRATTSHNLARIDLPIEHVQQRCINVFPTTAAQRLKGGTDQSTWWYGCGYDPDQTGTDPIIGGDCRRGNGLFTTCNYTKAQCVERGMFDKDSSNRKTGRFKAIQWAPSTRETQSKSYAQGKNVTVFSSRNDSIYERSYPLVYGSQWVKHPLIANTLGDGNSTRCEVVICEGDVGLHGVNMVVVNGVVIPRLGSSPDNKIFRWNFVGDPIDTHTGTRNGSPTRDAGYTDSSGNPQGDPYGSLATIEIVVYIDLAQSSSAPDVRILSVGPLLKTPTSADPAGQAGWPYLWTNLSAWVLLDLLIWANYQYSELDLQTFMDASDVCNVQVSYTDAFGATKQRGRYCSEFALEDRRKANEVLQAVARGFNAQLVPNSTTGLLQLFIRQTLADQQPAPVPGSNYNTAVASLTADNTGSTGYLAYLIDESVIQQDGKGVPIMRGPYCLPNAQTPNRLSFGFQNADNGYSDDSLSIADPDDVARAGGYQLGGALIDSGFPVMGISTFDQGTRVGNCILAESFRGNPIGDTRGTYFWDIEATHRIEHLRVGHIVGFRYEATALSPAVTLSGLPSNTTLARVVSITPTTDYERIRITIAWHEDEWYTDVFGQRGAPGYSNPLQASRDRLPYVWKPYGQQPCVGNSLHDPTDWGFQISQIYETAADGTGIAKLGLAGCPPVNIFSPDTQPPVIAIQGTTANTGGTIRGGATTGTVMEYFIHLSAYDANNLLTPMSNPCKVVVPNGTNTNTITTAGISWPSGAVGYYAFAQTHENALCFQATAAGTPATITLTDLNTATWGPPDQLFTHFMFRLKREIHGGVWGAACSAVDVDTLEFLGATFTTDQWAGYDITLFARADSLPDAVPIIDLRVVSNTADTLTIGANDAGISPPDLTTIAMPDDVWVMRTKPDTFTATTIGDSNFVNFFGTSGLDADAEFGNQLIIIKGTGRYQRRNITTNNSTVITVDPPFHTIPDATSRFIVVESAWTDQMSDNKVTNDPLPFPPPTAGLPDITNYAAQSLFVEVLAADAQDFTALEILSPFREIYLFGAQGTRVIATSE